MKLDAVQQAAQKQFGQQSKHYGQSHILQNIEDVREAVAQIPLPCPAQVLDVATGAGHTGLFLASLGHEVTLADIAQPMLDRAAQTAAERGLKVQTRQQAAEELLDENEKFDLVTCRVAAHHFSSPEKFIRETSRVLKTGSHFLLIDGTVEDHEPEAEAWAHTVEKLRDPSHHRFLTPNAWKTLCENEKLTLLHCHWVPFKQPDLEWYFATAATSPENRQKVLELVAYAPESARRLFNLRTEDGKIVWWWQRLTLLARKV